MENDAAGTDQNCGATRAPASQPATIATPAWGALAGQRLRGQMPVLTGEQAGRLMKGARLAASGKHYNKIWMPKYQKQCILKYNRTDAIFIPNELALTPAGRLSPRHSLMQAHIKITLALLVQTTLQFLAIETGYQWQELWGHTMASVTGWDISSMSGSDSGIMTRQVAVLMHTDFGFSKKLRRIRHGFLRIGDNRSGFMLGVR